MKKIVIFILFLIALILSEYYFLNEIFARQRIFILLPSLLVTLLSIFAIVRFFKKFILSSKQSEAHS